jgi:hypothetical protein
MCYATAMPIGCGPGGFARRARNRQWGWTLREMCFRGSYAGAGAPGGPIWGLSPGFSEAWVKAPRLRPYEKWQADQWPGLTSRRSGSSFEQMSCAM